jgi:hypothetical protein
MQRHQKIFSRAEAADFPDASDPMRRAKPRVLDNIGRPHKMTAQL